MNPLPPLQQHQQLCDDIYQCVMDENRFLRQHQRVPDAAMLARKRILLGQLDDSLGALRAVPAASARAPELQAGLEKNRARILQILQLEKENEQLLLRCSLASSTSAAAAPAPASSLLQKIYARCK
jgi:hypothetical protein